MDISTDSPKKEERNSILLRDNRFLTWVMVSFNWLIFLIVPITFGALLESFFLQLIGFVFGLLVFIAITRRRTYEFKVYSADEAHRKVNEIYGKFD